MLAHYVIDASDRHGMDHLARQYLRYDPIPITALIGEKKPGVPQGNMADRAPEEICDYAAEDADVTLQLDRVLRKEAQAGGCVRALKDCEEPLIRVLLEMTELLSSFRRWKRAEWALDDRLARPELRNHPERPAAVEAHPASWSRHRTMRSRCRWQATCATLPGRWWSATHWQ